MQGVEALRAQNLLEKKEIQPQAAVIQNYHFLWSSGVFSGIVLLPAAIVPGLQFLLYCIVRAI